MASALPPVTPVWVASDLHRAHDPQNEIWAGVRVPHLERPARADAIEAALRAERGWRRAEPVEHGAGLIRAVHDPEMVAYLESAWEEWVTQHGTAHELVPDTVLHPGIREGMGSARAPASPKGRLGWWCYETMTPILPGTYAAARAAVDIALTAVDLAIAGERVVYGLCRPPGHHAARAVYGGYCYFNNAAIAAHALASRGERVAVLDVDLHHGNGTQQIFYRRAEVLYVSLHADPSRTYPYFTGYRDETGRGAGAGSTVNLPLPAGCDDAAYLDALETGLLRISVFAPRWLVVSLGVDTYHLDPLSDLAITTRAYHETGARVAGLGLPLVVLQEGGYHVPDLGTNVGAWLRGAAGMAMQSDASPSS